MKIAGALDVSLIMNSTCVNIGLHYIHSSLKRGSALGPTLPNVLMISMCKEY